MACRPGDRGCTFGLLLLVAYALRRLMGIGMPAVNRRCTTQPTVAARVRAWLLLALFLGAGSSLPSPNACLHMHPDRTGRGACEPLGGCTTLGALHPRPHAAGLARGGRARLGRPPRSPASGRRLAIFLRPPVERAGCPALASPRPSDRRRVVPYDNTATPPSSSGRWTHLVQERLLCIRCYQRLWPLPQAVVPGIGRSPARTITGRVADSTGTALPDVRVRVLELGRGTTTDAEGRVALTQLPSGTYEVAFCRDRLRPGSATGHRRERGHRPRRGDAPIYGRAAEVQVTASPNATTCARRRSPRASWPATIFASPKPPRSARLSTDSPVSTASMKARPSGSRLSGASARAACSARQRPANRDTAGATSTRRISRPPTRSGSR